MNPASELLVLRRCVQLHVLARDLHQLCPHQRHVHLPKVLPRQPIPPGVRQVQINQEFLFPIPHHFARIVMIKNDLGPNDQAMTLNNNPWLLLTRDSTEIT